MVAGAQVADADTSLPALLARLGLASAADRLRDTSISALSAMLATDGRTALLAHLKAKGVERLIARVGIANAVERALELQPALREIACLESPVPMERAVELEPPPPPRPQSASEADARHADERPYPNWLVGGQVARVHWSDPQLEEYLRTSQPVVITGGCPFARGLVGKWSMSHLSEHYGV